MSIAPSASDIEGRPFGPALDQRFLYPSRSYSRALNDVQQALRRRDGLIVVTGEAGTGKTLLCRTLLHEMDEAAFVSVVLDPRIAGDDLVAHILTDFGVTRADSPIPAHARTRALSAALQRFLRELIPVNGYAVIIIDEAQHLEPGVLEQLRLLMNFETDEAKLLQVVLVGQPDLEQRLRQPEMRAFDQRVARRCEMQPLSGYEVKRYIDRRLSTAQQLAGSWRGTFTPAAARAVARASHGVPRVVNLVCDLALEMGHQRRTRVIDARIVRAAARRLNVETGARQWPWKTTAAATVAFTLVTGAIMTSWGPASAGPRPSAPASTVAVALPAHAASARAVVGVLPVADGITVTVGSFKSPARAAAVAAQVHGLALPAFTRVRDGEWHQVVVGPYVTATEAAAAHKGLAAHGFTDSAVVGEPSPRLFDRAGSPSSDARALLLVSADRLSLVLQLAEEPKKVASSTVNGSTLQIDVGPVTARHQAEQLNPRTGIPVIAQVALQDVEGAGREPVMRARVTLQGASRSDVRVLGRRVYVDFTPEPASRLKPAPTPVDLTAGRADTPQFADVGSAFRRTDGRLKPAPATVDFTPARADTAQSADVGSAFRRTDGRLKPAPATVDFTPARADTAQSADVGSAFRRTDGRLKPAPATAVVSTVEVAPVAVTSTYDDAIGPVVSRLAEIQPFLLSATTAPAADVLAALAQTLTGLHDSLRAIAAPPAAAPSHALLVSAVDQARQSVGRDFSGDRAAQARQAIVRWTQAAQRKES